MTMHQCKQSHYFPGSNTRVGFVGFFDSIFDPSELKRLFVLKGGPGVGKSTLMKRIASFASQRGIDVDCYHCSSDPQSLDGIVLRGVNIALVDGTAPHIVDPKLPIASDELIDLAAGLKKEPLIKARDSVQYLQEDMRRLFKKAHSLVAAADELKAAASALFRYDKRSMLSFINAMLPDVYSYAHTVSRAGRKKEVFLSAVTPDGIVSRAAQTRCTQLWMLSAPWGFDLTECFDLIAMHCSLNGAEVKLCRDPMNAARSSGVIIADDLLITSEFVNGLDYDRHVDLNGFFFDDPDDSCVQAMYDELASNAVTCLNSARELHSLLESPYSAAMDFSVCDKAFQAITSFICSCCPSPTAESGN